MEFKELKKKSISEISSLLAEQRASLRELRFKDGSKQLKNVRSIRNTRAQIARCLMLLKSLEKENIKTTK